MPNYIQDTFDRIKAMQKEALASLSEVDVLLWPNTQESFPYITNRLGTMTVDTDTFSEDIEAYMHTVLMRLVVGHITEGYQGEPQDLTYQYIELIETYFRQHPMLQTDAGSYTDEPNYLLIAQGNGFQAHLTGHTGLVAMQNSGVLGFQLGCEFTLQVPYIREVF